MCKVLECAECGKGLVVGEDAVYFDYRNAYFHEDCCPISGRKWIRDFGGCIITVTMDLDPFYKE